MVAGALAKVGLQTNYESTNNQLGIALFLDAKTSAIIRIGSTGKRVSSKKLNIGVADWSPILIHEVDAVLGIEKTKAQP